MSTSSAHQRSFGSVIRRRWWILPIVLILASAVVVLKALTAPLTVAASVGDGSQLVVRTATVVLHFNQDVEADSVQSGVRITPLTLATVAAQDARTFEIKPWLQPDTAYQLTVSGVRKRSGFGTANYSVSFKTEPAPRVMAVSFNDAPLNDGQQAVSLRGKLKVVFSQPMDQTSTAILFDGKALDARTISWDGSGKLASADLRVSPSRAHSVLVPQAASNRRHDQLIADWKLTFSAMVQVPSAGSTARIGSGGPIIIQIENSTQPTVRPQTGMQQADMVYEYISEFGIPRLSAVYWHPPSSLIGPVRSCRLITVQLEQMYRGMIYCSGANDYVLGQVWKWPNVVYDYNYMYDYMYRAGDRVAPHNVIARPESITNHTAQANLPVNYDIAPAHPDVPLPGAIAGTSVYIPQHSVTWRYDANSREYLKWQDGAPFGNVGTGQIHAKNVIVERVQSRLDTSPGNTGVHRDYNTEYYELAGEGTADIYSDGGVIHTTWRHPDRNLPVVYYGADGNPVDLNTGLTWVHVLGSDQ